MAVYAVWYGGASYAPFDPETWVETFADVADAGFELERRWSTGGSWKRPFQYVNREPESVYTPVVSDDTEMHVYLALDTDADGRVLIHDNGPDMVLTLTPEGDFVATDA